jgi:isoleucyl-tRNA synthetase
MTQKPDYKSTLRLPVTEFPMKGNLNVKEPEIIKNWQNKNIYQKVMAKNKGKTPFSLPDGPPYANGSIHMGHTLNKCLKDFVIKYKNLRGFQAPFIPGWDCHGLPIEHKVLKDLQEKKKTANDHEILALCRAEASKWIESQMSQFRRLGVVADWENPYLTMSADYEAECIREFARMYEKGLVYQGVRPVYWNWTLKTALADAEIEYHNHKSPAIYVKFKIEDAATLQKIGNPSEPTSIVIWTTTPWTIPANVGISLHPEFDYGVYQSGGENLIIAKNLKEAVEKDAGLQLTLKSEFKGQILELGKARHPWINRDSIIVLGDHVTQEAGTGAVHTAPGHGADDFKVGQKYGLPVLCPVTESGTFTDEVPEWKGLNIFKANPLIIEKLQSIGALISVKQIEHSYPHCWRSKTPLIFRTTPQWFLGLDLEKNNLRKSTLKSLENVGFYPEWGRARFVAMMEGRPDWCLSRQRIWGVPIPIYYCKKTGKPLADINVMMKVADLVETQGGIEAYMTTTPESMIGEFKPVGEFGSEGFRHGKDILDVWFDSGVSHATLLKRREGMHFPADLYLEGSDQHRGWFNTSMLASQAVNGVPPYKNLLTHGFVTDSKGYKMSKSVGNVVDPMDIANQNGAEILRLWVSSADYGQDVPYGKEDLARVTEVYRRFRNTFRYVLGAISDFNPQKGTVQYNDLTDIDKWALHQTAVLYETVTQAYDNFEFYKVYHALNQFFTVTLSATYLDVLKDRLYTWKSDGTARRGSQTVIYEITSVLMRLMTPITTFLSEEVYSYFPGKKQESILLEDYPQIPTEWKNVGIADTFEKALKVRSEVQKKLEELRAAKTIGSSLEAHVKIQTEGETYEALQKIQDLREFLIVSVVDLQQGPYNLETIKADGQKCERCWVYSTEIGKNPSLPGVCPKCVEALT